MRTANMDIRITLWTNAIPHYELAAHLGIHAQTLHNWLRLELTPERRAVVEGAIADMLAEHIPAVSNA